MVSSTTMLQENHLKKRNIRKVKDATISKAPKAISMVHGKYKISTQAFFFLFFAC